MVDFASAQAIFGKSRGAFRVFQFGKVGGGWGCTANPQRRH